MNYSEWKNEIKPEKKERTYQHVDDSLNLEDDKVFERIVRAIEDVKNHQFLPFNELPRPEGTGYHLFV